MKSLLLVFVVALFACAPYPVGRFVRDHEYRDQNKCWRDDTETVSFLVLHDAPEGLYPYMFSVRCDVIVDGYQNNMGFVAYLKTIRLSDKEGVLHRAGNFRKPVLSNISNHAPVPEGNDKVYLFRGHLKGYVVNGIVHSNVSHVLMLVDSRKLLSDFAVIPVSERPAFFYGGTKP
jgi:hypothetical protein